MVIRLTNNDFNDDFTAFSGNYGIWGTSNGRDNKLFLFNGIRTVRLSNNADGGDEYLGGAGRYVVWRYSDFPNQKLYLYNGVRIIKLTDNTLSSIDSLAGISERYVVWSTGSRFDRPQTNFYNGRTINRLTTNIPTSTRRVSDRYIVYETEVNGNSSSFLYDGLRNNRLGLGGSDVFFGGTGGINDRFVVWQDFDGNDVELFAYNGSTIRQLTDNTQSDEINFNVERVTTRFVAFESSDGNDTELYAYNGTSLLNLTNDDSDSSSFAGISNSYAVWDYLGELSLYNGNRIIRLTGDTTTSESVTAVSDKYVLWKATVIVEIENPSEYFLYNGRRTIQLTNNEDSESFLGISNRYVAWRGFDGILDNDRSDEFFAYNGRRSVRLTNDRTTSETFLNISDRYLVWSANDGNDIELYAYDGTKVIQLTNNSAFDSFQDVSDQYIYWTSTDGTDNEIFVYNGFRTIQVTRNTTNDLEPTIAGNNLYWRNFDGNDDELYAQNLNQYAPNIVVSNVTAVEGFNNFVVFTVRLSNAGAFPVTVRYSTANGTAIASRDYQAQTGKLTFSPGQTRKTIAIRLLNNNLNERNETFSLRLRNSQNGSIADGLGVSTISDTLSSRVSRTLLPSVENLILTGNANTNGIGNAKNNFLIGNRGRNRLNGLAGNDVLTGASGNDRITGGWGRDRLTGGQGADLFVYNFRNERRDTITDFSPANDTILVSARGFGGGLRAGKILPLAQFRLGTRALDASDRFIYNRNTGALLFDVDGTGAIAPIAFANLDPRLALTRADIFVTA